MLFYYLAFNNFNEIIQDGYTALILAIKDKNYDVIEAGGAGAARVRGELQGRCQQAVRQLARRRV